MSIAPVLVAARHLCIRRAYPSAREFITREQTDHASHRSGDPEARRAKDVRRPATPTTVDPADVDGARRTHLDVHLHACPAPPTADPDRCATRSGWRIRRREPTRSTSTARVFSTALTINLTSRPARAEQHQRAPDDRGPGGRSDGQRRREQPGAPVRCERHGVDLGADDHRRQRERLGRRPGQLRRDGLAHGLHDQRKLRRGRRRRVHRRDPTTYYGTTTLNDCTVSGNSASGSGGGVFDVPGHDQSLYGGTVSGNSAGGNGGGVSDLRRRG